MIQVSSLEVPGVIRATDMPKSEYQESSMRNVYNEFWAHIGLYTADGGMCSYIKRVQISACRLKSSVQVVGMVIDSLICNTESYRSLSLKVPVSWNPRDTVKEGGEECSQNVGLPS